MENKSFVVIVTYNGMQWLDKCLKSCSNYSIIVVDNASTDITVSFVETNFPNVIVLKQNKNLGFGQANNIGIRYALDSGAERVFLLNQDAYLIDNVLDNLIAIQNAQPEYGILSPIHLNANQDKLDFNFSNYVSSYNNFKFYSDYVLNRTKESVYDVPFVNAAGWLISKRCLTIVGGFDPLFFHYGEDDNYCQRVIYHNLKIGVVPDCFIIHDRENRKNPVVVPYSERAFKLLERRIKVKYANINNDEALSQMNLEIKQLEKKLFKLLIKAKFNKLKGLKTELELYKQIAPQISESRDINSKKGKTHL